MSDLVRVEAADRVCTITLHRPEARNALNTALHRASGAALAAAEDDEGVDVVVLTGADPAFCAGLDLKELGSGGANLAGGRGDDHDDLRWTNPIQAVWAMTKPVIGAINGACVTGGFELALGCDFLVASERAFFGDTHARVGVTPGGGMSVYLPMAVGLRRAKEMSLTGNFIDAAEAHRLGLVNRVVAHEELASTAHSLAMDIAGNDGPTVRHLKQLYDHNAALPVGEAIAHEQAVFRDYRVDFDEIERRRAAIVDRGRSQR
ncbi:MAG: enoyl-CoA hydratase [Acidimicrobiia bacterium]|nr:enoyl-CoA hydratase [Acidimicrobiia bacterium]